MKKVIPKIDRVFQKVNSERLGFSRSDALLAVRMLVEAGTPSEKKERVEQIAAALSLVPNSVILKLNGKVESKRQVLDSDIYGKNKIQFNYFHKFQDSDYLVIAHTLGPTCTPPAVFETVEAMMDYARTTLHVPYGKKWSVPSSGGNRRIIVPGMESLPLYREAARLLIPLTGQDVKELTEYTHRAANFRTYLVTGRSSLSDSMKMENMTSLAHHIGYALAVANGTAETAPNMDAEAMLAEARRRFPENKILNGDMRIDDGKEGKEWSR